MPNIKHSKKGFITTIFLFLTATYINACTAGEIDIEDKLNSKISKVKARYKMMASEESDDYFNNNFGQKENCGSIDIGNIKDSKRPSSSKEVTVIITGDVVNTNNKCK